MNLRIIDFRPPKIAQLFILAAVILHWTTPLKHLTIYSNLFVSVILGVAGLVIMMWGWWLFKKFDAAICPTARAECLVTSGVYQLTRNPMYLGILLMIIGIAVYVGTLPFYLAAIAYFYVMNNIFCPYEESKLIESFGVLYCAYKNRVRRWL